MSIFALSIKFLGMGIQTNEYFEREYWTLHVTDKSDEWWAGDEGFMVHATYLFVCQSPQREVYAGVRIERQLHLFNKRGWLN